MSTLSTDTFAAQRTALEPRLEKLVFYNANGVLSTKHVLWLMRSAPEFCTFFSQTLAASQFQAFRWETPAMYRNKLEGAFECVLVDCPSLIRPADAQTFSEFFVSKPPVSVEDFPNLGGDAHLIVPHPPTAGSQSNHVHLASFVRHANDQQIQQLWQRCAESVERLVGQRPTWLNTAGDGVAWLHIRVDQRPKYYHYKPYTQN